MIEYNEKIDVRIPSKVMQILDGNCKLVFGELMRLIYPKVILNKCDERGYVEIPMSVLTENLDMSKNKLRAILSTLHSSGLIIVKTIGSAQGRNGKGSEVNKYKFSSKKINEICSHPFSKTIQIKTEDYNKKGYKLSYISNMNTTDDENEHHVDMVFINETYGVHNCNGVHSYGVHNCNGVHSYGVHNCNGVHSYGVHNCNSPIEYTSNIIYNTSEIKEKKNIPSVGNTLSEKVKSNNEETLSEEEKKRKEKNKKQSPSMVKETNITEGLDFSSLSSTGSEEVKPTEENKTEAKNIELQMVRNYDGNRPNLDIKYFKYPPSVIDDPAEFERYAKALLYQFRGVTNWTDYLGSRGMLNRLRKAGEASMTEEYMTTKGTKMEQYHIKRFNERYGKVDAILHKYFKLKLERLPYDGQNDMYSYFSATAMKYDAYKQTVGEIDAKQLKWKAGKYTYKFDSFINDKTIEFLTKNG